MRFLFLILIAYIVYRLLDFLIFPIFRQAFGKQEGQRGENRHTRETSDRESAQDWGGKYVDYEEVKEEEDDKGGKDSAG